MWQAVVDCWRPTVSLLVIGGLIFWSDWRMNRRTKNAGFVDPRVHPRWSDPAAGRVPPTRPAPSNDDGDAA